MPRNDLIQVRRDTAAEWTDKNPTLASGEMGFETDTGKFKIGTGSTAWNSLPYATTIPPTTVTSTMIVDGTIVNADINASAAIALSKLATGALPTAITVASANLVDGTIVNADIDASAAIAPSKVAGVFITGDSSNNTITISTSAPSGGSSGDIWLKY
jgi:hypothetical protein